ncbi:MAG: P-loop NTPase fold protein [Cetobacterium sp.]
MYFFRFVFFYFVSITVGYLVPQITKSTVGVSELLNKNGEIVTNTQFIISPNGRVAIVALLFISWIFFLSKYKRGEDREVITAKVFVLFQIYICFSGFLYGMNIKNNYNFLIIEFFVGVLFSFFLLLYSEKIAPKKKQEMNIKFQLYPSREILKKKLEYLLSDEDRAVSSILIDGDWGVGKTYFLDCVLSDKKGGYDILKYDALLFDSREKLVKAFLDDLKILSKKYKFLIGDSSDYFSILEPVVSKLPFGLGEIFSKKMSLEDSKKEFKKFSERLDKQIVVVVDNFERILDKKAFIQMIGFLHELNEFDKIKVIAILDRKKLERIGIKEDYVDKFFINRVELKEVPIQEILEAMKNIEQDIELDKIAYDLERIKNEYLKEGSVPTDLKVKTKANFQNPRIYEQAFRRFELHIKNYVNIYSEIEESEYKNTMFLSSLLYFLLPNLEDNILDQLISKGGETVIKKAIKRDYYDTGTDIGDEAEKIMLTDKIELQIEKHLQKLIYSNDFIPKYKDIIKDKYLDFLKELKSRKNLKFNIYKIESTLFPRLGRDILRLEKEFDLTLEDSIIKITRKNLEYKSIKDYTEDLISLYRSEIQEVAFYVDPVGEELELGEVITSEELKDRLDYYFCDIRNVDEHLEGVLNIIEDEKIKQKLEEFIEKYKVLREDGEEIYGSEMGL